MSAILFAKIFHRHWNGIYSDSVKLSTSEAFSEKTRSWSVVLECEWRNVSMSHDFRFGSAPGWTANRSAPAYSCSRKAAR